MARIDRVRTFFALWPVAEARQALARLASDVARHARGRATREANLHVTLAFVGDVDRARIAALAECGEESARACASFALALDRLGGTGGGLVWIAASDVPGELATLHDALREALVARGFPVEARAYRPHVTLARRCVQRRERAAVEPIAWHVDRVALVASVTGGEASAYRDIAQWPLGDAPGGARQA